jgi:dihydropteroate synthase
MNSGTLSSEWQLARRTLLLGGRPCLMGILNCTPDSFSDGARYLDPIKAEDHAARMVAAGADIIDIGGESTRPGASQISVDEELRRVMPIVERLVQSLPVPLSIDTTKAEVARIALANGAEIINDISGCTFDDAMLPVVTAARAGLVIMHTRGVPAVMQLCTDYTDIVAEVKAFLAARIAAATACGMSLRSIVIDPGIGFGKDVQGNLTLLRNLSELTALGTPVLVGTSRKGFIGKILGRDVHDRGYGTAATIAFGVMQGAKIFRVHDVAAMRDAADMTAALMGGWSAGAE